MKAIRSLVVSVLLTVAPGPEVAMTTPRPPVNLACAAAISAAS